MKNTQRACLQRKCMHNPWEEMQGIIRSENFGLTTVFDEAYDV